MWTLPDLGTRASVSFRYCYCKDCQEAHGSLSVEGNLVGKDAFKWTKGEDHLLFFNRTEHEKRAKGAPGA